MVKKLAGLSLGATLVAMLTGYSAGCSSDDPVAMPEDAQVAEVRPRIDRAEEPSLACLQPPQEFVYRPPLARAGLCSAEQISEFLNCFGAAGDEAKCRAFLEAGRPNSGGVNEACLDTCLFTAANRPNYGALIDVYVNYVGYYALSGVSSACVQAQWQQFACEVSSCDQCETEETRTCLETIYAEGGQCFDIAVSALQACQPEEALVNGLDADLRSLEGVGRILTAFCGSADPGDAGPDAPDAEADAEADAESDADVDSSLPI